MNTVAIDVRHLDCLEIQKKLLKKGYKWGGTVPRAQRFEGVGFLVCRPRDGYLTYIRDSEEGVLYLLRGVGKGELVLRTLEEL